MGLSQKFIIWQETKSSRLKWDLDTYVKSSVDVCISLPGCSHLESLEGVSASELLDRSLGQVWCVGNNFVQKKKIKKIPDLLGVIVFPLQINTCSGFFYDTIFIAPQLKWIREFIEISHQLHDRIIFFLNNKTRWRLEESYLVYCGYMGDYLMLIIKFYTVNKVIIDEIHSFISKTSNCLC